MTDIVIVDEAGNFRVGKAPTTPNDESVGFWNSLGDALEGWGIDLEKEATSVLPKLAVAIYSGTTMLNTILTRRGSRLGLIITKGFEDSLLQERGAQVWTELSYSDRLHAATHFHEEPLIPKRLIRGVTERVDLFGKVAIPLYEAEVRRAVKELIDDGVEGIVVCFLFSFMNPVHEKRTAAIAREVIKTARKAVPVYISSDISPVMRELSRLNSAVLDAYAAGHSRTHLQNIENKLVNNRYQHQLHTITASGGLVTIRYPRLVETLVSGPTGGMIGAKFLGESVGMRNIITADMGGTSFDVGIITERTYSIAREVTIGRYMVNIPSIVMNSIGAGTGMYVRIDPLRKRIQLGPDSAQARPGPVCYDTGNEIPTIMDCDLILGFMNPDYYLGGKIKLKKEKSLKAIAAKVAEPLGIDAYDTAAGVCELINTRMREFLKTMTAAKGLTTAEYSLLAYGGAGPLHLFGYSQGLPFADIITMPWAAGFSAFGLSTIDFTYRYQKSCNLSIPSEEDDSVRKRTGGEIDAIWRELETKARKEMTQEGLSDVRIKRIAYLRYANQLEDLEVYSPVDSVREPRSLGALLSSFEDLYRRVYTTAATYREAGFQILELGLEATSPKVRPRLEKKPLGDERPQSALKGEREVYFQRKWARSDLYEMSELKPGNVIRGPAVVEATNTTMPIPPGGKVKVDEFNLLRCRW